MSLQTKLTALAQAVGADIKALNAKVTTTESYIQTAGGASLNATSGILPVGAITQSSTPAPFSRNADGTLTCLQDGVYQLNAVINCSSGLAANTNVQYQINVNGSAVGYTTNAPVWPHTTLPWLGKLLAGQVVSVYVAGIGATSLQCAVAAFSAARTQAGPQGVKGDLGGVLGANSFRQLAASAPAATSNWRTILVSATNEMDPAGAFTRNADGSITIRDSGWYSVSATFRVVTVAALCTFVLTDALNAPGNPFCTDTKSLSPNYSNSMGADNYFAAGAKIYPNVWTDVSTQIELSYFVISRLGGTKGDKGDTGGNATVPMDGWHLLGAVGEPAINASFRYYGGGTTAPAYRKDPLGKVQMRGLLVRNNVTSNIITNLPVGLRPSATNVDCWRFVVSSTDGGAGAGTCVVTVFPDGNVTWASGPYGGVANHTIALDGVEFDTDSVTQMPTGPQGAKGDPGGVNVLTTLNWNTALTPNFYRSTTDFLQQTINGPGDALNPPPQAGIVSTLDNGTLVQRVWDLQTQRAYTRYLSGSTWTAWVADFTKPPVLATQIVGGAAPEEGDERYFQTAAMLAQGVIWKFRYSKAQNKWQFVGGSDLLFATPSLAATAGASAIDATNLAFTVVLSGSYDVSWGARMYQNPSGPSSGNILLFADQMRGASAITSPGMDLWAGPISGQTWSTVVQNFKTFRFDPVQNGDIIRLRSQSINYNAAIESPIMRIKPVSVLM